MPEIPEHLFLDGIRALVDCQRKWIPNAPGSLYIRPTMIGTEPCIGVRASNEYLFFVIVLPSGSYFPGVPSGSTGTVRVFVYRDRGPRRDRRNRRCEGGRELLGDAASDRRKPRRRAVRR